VSTWATQASHRGSASHVTRDPLRAPFSTAWNTHLGRLLNANPVPNYIGATSKQVGFLGQRRQHTTVNAMPALRTILLRLVPPLERDTMRVYRMCYNKYYKGKKIFEYLVDITENQLRISLSPILVAKLKGN
jgi:hypothetical protein